jgi:CheY-like chemotaxis protein
VIEACDGLEALARWQDGAPDLAVMDMQMPRMDGVSAIRELRRREAGQGSPARLPVIVLTANSQDEERALCLQAGADAVLGKPAGRAALVATAARCLATAANPAPNLLPDRRAAGGL